MERNCYRCDTTIEEPVDENANYVRGEDTTETVQKEVPVEKRHNEYTRAIRDRLMDEHSLNATQANSVLSRNDTAYLQRGMSHDVTDTDLDENETIEPSSPEEDPEVIRVDTHTKEVADQRTGLVCPDCVDDADEIIW